MDKPQIDTTTLLWDYIYLVRIPQLQTTSIDYLRQHGSYVTGDAGIDRDLANQWTTTMLSISKMVDYYREGVQIKIVKQSDVKEIYDHISLHLAAWTSQLERGINIGNAPIEDLIALDEFANAVYDHAKYQFTANTVSSILAQRLNAVTRINVNNFFDPKTTQAMEDHKNGIIRINQEDPNEPPQRESLGGFLKQRLSGMKRW